MWHQAAILTTADTHMPVLPVVATLRSPGTSMMEATDRPLCFHQPHAVINIDKQRQKLPNHHDTSFASPLLHDLTYGSQVGLTDACSGLISLNLCSARKHPEVISSSLRKE